MKTKAYFIILCISILVFSAATGNTLAYWVVEDKTDNALTTGKLVAEIVEEFIQGQTLYPGDTVSKVVNVQNTGDVDAVIRVSVSGAWGSYDSDGNFTKNNALSPDNIVINYHSDLWTYDSTDGYFYYRGVLKPEELTKESLFSSFQIMPDTDDSYAGSDAEIFIRLEAVQAGFGGVSVWGKTLDSLGIEYADPDGKIDDIPVITFVDDEVKFKFESEGDELFCSFEHLIPGECRSQVIEVVNAYSTQVPILFKAFYSGDSADMPENIRELMQKYVSITITGEDGVIVYNGPVLREDNGGFIDLGYFEPGESKKYNVSLQVDKDMDNRYAGLVGEIGEDFSWLFRAMGDGDTPITPPPATGENIPWLSIILMIASGTVIILLIIARRKRKYC